MRVDVRPAMLAWALERSGMEPDALALRFPKLPDWLDGSVMPTLKQLELFAKATYTPLGSFFLPAPLVEILPIPDFRVMGGGWPIRPSPNLLETIYICQQRQEWYRDHANAEREDKLSFVGSESVESDVISVQEVRALLAIICPCCPAASVSLPRARPRRPRISRRKRS
jgi:hypothetical protein